MTKIQVLTATATLLCAAGTMSADNAPDTIARITNARTVVVVSDGNSSTIRVDVKPTSSKPAYVYTHTTNVVEDNEGEAEEEEETTVDEAVNSDNLPELPFLHRPTPRRHRTFTAFYGRDLYTGPLMPVANDQGFTTGWEAGWSQMVGGSWQPFAGGPSLNLGVGIGIRMLKLNSRHLFAVHGDGRLAITPLPEGMQRASTRLHMWSLQMPLTIRQHIRDGFTIELGAALTYNFYTTASCDYRTEDNQYRYKEKYKHLHQRNFGVDLRLGFGWANDFGFYLRYAPVSIFTSDLGPQTDMLSAGICVAF